MLRVYSNLTMFHILESKYTKALEYFGNIMELLQKEKDIENKQQLLKFTTFLFFRVSSL